MASGVIFRIEGCRALVKADVANKRVQVFIDGPAGDLRGAVDKIKPDFDSIHTSIPEPKPRELVRLPGHPEHLIDYQSSTIFGASTGNNSRR